MTPTRYDHPSRQHLPRWARYVAWLGFWTGLAASLLMLLAGPAYRLHIVSLGTAFSLLGMAAKGGVGAAVIALTGLILSLLARRSRLAWIAGLGLLMGPLAFVPPWLFMHKARSVPPIHDISTDTRNPPAFQAVLALRKPGDNSAVYAGPKLAAQQHAAYPDIRPLHFAQPPDKVFAAALAVAKDMDWHIDADHPKAGRIEATATTFWFGFKDDVVIRVEPDGTGTRLDIRSASRIGVSDVGKNADRIRDFRSRIDQRLRAPG